MSFSDEDIMRFVDGDIDANTAALIENAAKKDPKLKTQIKKFQLANSAMLSHVEKETQMPTEFYNELRNKRILVEQSQKQNKSLISKIIGAEANSNYLKNGLIAASIAGFGFFAAFQTQVKNNGKLGQEFFASFENRSELMEGTKINFSKEIMLANIEDYLSSSASAFITRGLNSKEKTKKLANSIMLNTPPDLKQSTIEIEVIHGETNSIFRLPANGLVSIGSKIKIIFSAKHDGKLQLVYSKTDSKNTPLMKLPYIYSKLEQKVLGPYEVTKPIGSEYIQYIFESDSNQTSSTREPIWTNSFGFRVIDPTNNFFTKAFNKFEALDSSFFSKLGFSTTHKTEIKIGPKYLDYKILQITELFTSSNELFKPTIWKNKENFLIDLTNDNYANLVTIDTNGDGLPDYLSVDRNSNQKIDAAIKIYSTSSSPLAFQWFLDENEDGTPDKIADDFDGDWVIDQIYPI